MTEEALLTGPLEPTNEWYAIAKIAGIRLCQAYRQQYGRDYISVMPTNLYGPGDNFHPEHSHVPASLIRRFHEAKEQGYEKVEVWGSGTPLREFLYVDDLADACIFLLKRYSAAEHINIARAVKEAVGYHGELVFDTNKPDGAPRKLMDCSRLAALGWRYQTPLEQGLAQAYRWYLDNHLQK
jgi:GDP-L-fucose synthase